MSITGITSSSRGATTIADTPTASAPAKPSGEGSQVELDEVTQQPPPPRFPWLSRLSQQLGTASGQKPTFAPAPVLGDNLNRSV